MFNPYFRLSIEECLGHPFFKKVRKETEKESIASETVGFDWEKEHMDRGKLREHFVEEIMFFK